MIQRMLRPAHGRVNGKRRERCHERNARVALVKPPDRPTARCAGRHAADTHRAQMHRPFPSCSLCLVLATLCLTTTTKAAGAQDAPAAHWPARAVDRSIPLGPNIERAYRAGTRDSTGSPGPHYWQQSVDYVIEARLDVDSAVLHGTEHITLHNTSPDTLHAIVLRLLQNYYTADESRDDYVT